MASASPRSCFICSEDFSMRRPQVTLPCLHSLCKICVCHMELQNKSKCPTCCKTWTETLVEPSFSEMMKMFIDKDSLVGNEDGQQKKQENRNCATHGNEIELWCTDCKMLVCKNCISSGHKRHDLSLIDDCYQDFRQAMKTEAQKFSRNFVQKISSIDKNLSSLYGYLTYVGNLVDELTEADYKIRKEISDQQKTKDQLEKSYRRLPEVNVLLKNLETNADPSKMNQCQEILKINCVEYTPIEEKTTLIAMAEAYMSMEIMNPSVISVVEEHSKMSLKAFKNDEVWIIKCNYDAFAATFALKSIKPSHVTVESGTESIHPTALSMFLEDCPADVKVSLGRFESFIYGETDDCSQHLVALNDTKHRMRLTRFFGNFDSQLLESLASFPITDLGIVMKNPAEGKVLNEMEVWKAFQHLHVVVHSGINSGQLVRLPNHVAKISIYIYGANDGLYGNIRQILNALIPVHANESVQSQMLITPYGTNFNQVQYFNGAIQDIPFSIHGLCFMNCSFSDNCLVQLYNNLKGLRIENICFAMSKDARVTQKPAIEQNLKYVLNCNISWQMPGLVKIALQKKFK